MTMWIEPTLTRPRCGGFTLLELVVSAGVMSVIMLGLASTMLIAGRALPQAESAAGATAAAADAAGQMIADLRYATAINERSATRIEFTVADRNGNELPETICYEWSGTLGAPLVRQYNAGAPVTMLSNVREFSLSYDTQAIGTEVPQGNESPETLLIGCASSLDYGDYAVKSGDWFSEYFLPVLPADAISWTVTRVRFQAKQAGALSGETKVQLQLPTAGGFPGGIVLEEKTLYESALPLSYLPYEAAYENVSGLPPNQGLCLVFQWVSDAEACKLLGRNKNVTAPNLFLAKSSSQGASWSKLTGQSLLFSVYGTVITAGTPQIQSTFYLNSVQIQLRAGSDDRSLVRTAARTLNRPEVGE